MKHRDERARERDAQRYGAAAAEAVPLYERMWGAPAAAGSRRPTGGDAPLLMTAHANARPTSGTAVQFGSGVGVVKPGGGALTQQLDNHAQAQHRGFSKPQRRDH